MTPIMSPSRSRAESLESGGVKRTYRLYIPDSLKAQTPVPLVFVFHGGGSNALEAEGMSKFSRIAFREQFIAAYPDGIGHNFNDGRTGADLQPQAAHIDDVAFVDDMIAAISERHPVDPKRIYSTGISNGGMFSHFLAERHAERIAAIAPVVGGIAEPIADSFNPAEPVSVLIIQGTADPIVLYHGGKVDHGDRGSIIDTDRAVQIWIEKNGCRKTPVVSEMPGKDVDDGCRVFVSKWSGGRADSAVWLYRVEGGGHTWPNGPQYLPEDRIGKVCRDFDASETIWAFFKAHPKP